MSEYNESGVSAVCLLHGVGALVHCPTTTTLHVVSPRGIRA